MDSKSFRSFDGHLDKREKLLVEGYIIYAKKYLPPFLNFSLTTNNNICNIINITFEQIGVVNFCRGYVKNIQSIVFNDRSV